MGLLGSTIRAGAKSGLHVFGRSKAVNVQEPTEMEKLAKEMAHQMGHNTELAKQMAQQLGNNNEKMMSHIESLMHQHGETVKLLLEALKQMHGMG